MTITLTAKEEEIGGKRSSQWSEKKLEKLPHHLSSFQTEIQNLNEVIKTKESVIVVMNINHN